MNLIPEDLPDDPVLLKQMLLEALSRQQVTAEACQTHIVDLKEQIKLLRDRLFGRTIRVDHRAQHAATGVVQ